MQESLGKEYVSLDEMMAEVVTLRGRRAHAHRPFRETGRGDVTTGAPVPPAVPGKLVVRLGEGCNGPLHELVKEMNGHSLGAEAAAAMLLSWVEFVRIEVEGVEECRDQVGGLRLLSGAVMTARAAGCRRGSIDDFPISCQIRWR